MTDPSPGPDTGEWFRQAFDFAYLTVYAHRDEASADREAAFVREALGCRDGQRVLDAGSGAGRHSRALARAGLLVVGTDLSAPLLATAASSADPAAPAHYVRGDLRALPFRPGAFDHVVSLFTTFGYFDDAGDRAHLAGLRHVLRPGGGFLLDFLNAPAVRAGLVPFSEREVAGRLVRETRSIEHGRVRKAVTVHDPATPADPPLARWTESVRLYRREEVEERAVSAGFGVVAVYGDLVGGAWSPLSPRLVLVAEASA